MTTLAQDLGGVVLDGVRFEIVKVACRDEPGACSLRIHIDHQSFDIGRGFDDAEHAEWMAKQFSSALNRLVARTHSAEIAGALRDAERLDYIERTFTGMSNGERYLPLVMGWGKSRNGRTLREACDKYMQRESAMQQGGGGGE